MYTYHKRQIRVISEANLKDFQDEFNAFMDKLAEDEIVPEITFPQGTVGTAYIIYEESRKIAEDYSDKFYLIGERFHCADCPVWEGIDKPDKRIKYYKCPMTGKKVGKGSPSCEAHLKELWEARYESKQ